MRTATPAQMKYIVVSGGVVSGLGKGVTASSLGVLLRAAGGAPGHREAVPRRFQKFTAMLCVLRAQRAGTTPLSPTALQTADPKGALSTLSLAAGAA